MPGTLLHSRLSPMRTHGRPVRKRGWGPKLGVTVVLYGLCGGPPLRARGQAGGGGPRAGPKPGAGSGRGRGRLRASLEAGTDLAAPAASAQRRHSPVSELGRLRRLPGHSQGAAASHGPRRPPAARASGFQWSQCLARPLPLWSLGMVFRARAPGCGLRACPTAYPRGAVEKLNQLLKNKTKSAAYQL